MNAKTLKMIRRYAKLRGKKDPRLNADVLTSIYETASSESQKDFKAEMELYFRAIDEGRIEPGDSIIHISLTDIKD